MPAERMVVGFNDDGQPKPGLIPRVMSNPESKHYDDQHDAWLNGDYRRFKFGRAEILDGHVHRRELIRPRVATEKSLRVTSKKSGNGDVHQAQRILNLAAHRDIHSPPRQRVHADSPHGSHQYAAILK